MTTARDIIEPHIEAALAEAAEKKISSDAKAELMEAADHLDPDEDFMFMRP